MKRTPLRPKQYCPHCGRTLCDCGERPKLRRSRLPRFSAERQKRRQREGRVYGRKMEWARRQPCVLWDVPDHVCRPGTVAGHHVRSVGAGGTDDGIVCLCVLAHREVHSIGRATFEARYDIDLMVEAERTEERYRREAA